MNSVKEAYQKDKHASELILQFLQITDLSTLMPLVQKFSNLRRLSIHGNRLKTLPNDLTSLSMLEELDICNNMFSSLDDIINSLKTLPSLKHLLCNVRSKEEEHKIITSLPNLQTLNGVVVSRMERQASCSKSLKQSSMISQKNLEKIAMLYDRIRSLYKENGLELDHELAEEFDMTVEEIIKDLGSKLKSQTISKNSTEGRILCAKYALYDLCFMKLISLFGVIDQKFQSILQEIHNANAQILKEMAEIVIIKQPASENELVVLQKKIKLYEVELARSRNYQKSLLQEIEELNAQNRKYLEKFAALGRDPGIKAHTLLKTPERSPSARAMNRTSASNSKPVLVNFDTLKHTKTLNLIQAKDLITELFNTKAQQNKKCKEHKKPYETMEQYMYTYFNKKYGLKSLTLEWVVALVNSIKKYGQDDLDIVVFGKVLRNQLEEQYFFEQQETKLHIENLFKTQIRGKSQKLNHEINHIFHQKQTSGFSMSECQEVIRYYFERTQSEEVMRILVDRSKQDRMKSSMRDSNSKPNVRTIKYSLLLYIILQTNLRNHENIILPFVNQFRKVDTDSDGIVSQPQFRQLLNRLVKNISDRQYMGILSQVDPHSLGRLTFSALCHTLQNSPEQNPILAYTKL